MSESNKSVTGAEPARQPAAKWERLDLVDRAVETCDKIADLVLRLWPVGREIIRAVVAVIALIL